MGLVGRAWLWGGLICASSAGCYEHHLRPAGANEAGPDAWIIDGGMPDVIDGGMPDVIDGGMPDVIDSGPPDVIDNPDAPNVGPCTVPGTYPALQPALDDPSCDPILVTGEHTVQSLSVWRDVTVMTNPAVIGNAVIAGAGDGSVMTIGPNIAVTLERLELQGGRASQGGGIRSEGNLVLRDMVLEQNVAVFDPLLGGGAGGALYQIGGSLEVRGSSMFLDNRVEGQVAFGGALVLEQTQTVMDGHPVFARNQVEASQQALAGAIYVNGGNLEARGLELTGNTVNATDSAYANVGGGGLAAYYAGTVLHDLIAIGNRVSTRAATGSAGGGAIFVTEGRLELHGGYAAGNVAEVDATTSGVITTLAGFLGAVSYTPGEPHLIEDMLIENNTARASGGDQTAASASGGALVVSPARVLRTTFRGNRASVAVSGATPTNPGAQNASLATGGAMVGGIAGPGVLGTWMEECAFFENAATFEGRDGRGGDQERASGGAFFAFSGGPAAVIVRTTFVDNRAEASVESGAALATAGAIGFEPVGDFSATIESSTLSRNVVRASSAVTGTSTARGSAIGIEGSTASELPVVVDVTLSNLTIMESYVSANLVNGGALSAWNIGPAPSRVALADSILWGNTSSVGGDEHCAGSIASAGYNLLDSTLCFASFEPTDRYFVDPRLSELTFLSDRCAVHVPDFRSPALDTGHDGACASASGDTALDQCGRVRITPCIAGAVDP